jgi:hypothetical protein
MGHLWLVPSSMLFLCVSLCVSLWVFLWVSRTPTYKDSMPPPTQSPETENLKMQTSSRMGAVNQVFTSNHDTCVTDSTDILTKSCYELSCTLMDLNDRFWRDQCITTGPENQGLGLVVYIILVSGCPGHPQEHPQRHTQRHTQKHTQE